MRFIISVLLFLTVKFFYVRIDSYDPEERFLPAITRSVHIKDFAKIGFWLKSIVPDLAIPGIDKPTKICLAIAKRKPHDSGSCMETAQ